MEFRKTAPEDLPAVLEIIRQAQESLRLLGIDQWQNGYPDEETIRGDIARGYGYVLADEEGISATTAISLDGEPTYRVISGGRWRSGGAYGVIHRVAAAGKRRGRGLASELFWQASRICLKNGVCSLRADTHRGNLPMQGALAKNGFRRCGVIFLADGSERLAYEKLLTPENGRFCGNFGGAVIESR